MIIGFRDAETEKVWNGSRCRKLPFAIQAGAVRKLRLSMPQDGSTICACRPATGSKHCEEIAPDNGASASTTSGAFASAGLKEAQTMSRAGNTNEG